MRAVELERTTRSQGRCQGVMAWAAEDFGPLRLDGQEGLFQWLLFSPKSRNVIRKTKIVGSGAVQRGVIPVPGMTRLCPDIYRISIGYKDI